MKEKELLKKIKEKMVKIDWECALFILVVSLIALVLAASSLI